MKKIRIGIIGAGGIAAKMHIPELRSIPGVELKVIAGRKESRLETLCRKFSVPRWTHNYEDLLNDSEIDGIVIALPHPLHVHWGLRVLAAGKHLHIQKPLSTSMDEANQFVEATEKTDLTVLALPFVDQPQLTTCHTMVREGDLGKVSAAHARASHGGPEIYYAGIQTILEETPNDDLWFFDAKRAGVGALFDMGVYAISNLTTILGSVVSVIGRCTTVAKPTTLEDTAALLLTFESGAVGTVETGWCDGARTNEFSIHGTNGRLTFSFGSNSLLFCHQAPRSGENARPICDSIKLGDSPRENSHEYWIKCIRKGIQPRFSNARSARHITEIMLSGLASSTKGVSINVASRL